MRKSLRLQNYLPILVTAALLNKAPLSLQYVKSDAPFMPLLSCEKMSELYCLPRYHKGVDIYSKEENEE